jgi:hypothetical protein
MLKTFMGEIAESVLLGLLEPAPLRFTAQHERDVPRVRAAIRRASYGKLARLQPVNRNPFLLGCLDFTELEPIEHLIVGFGFRHGATTKIDGLHHVSGRTGSVGLPASVAHAMWDHFQRWDDSELVIYHNHPYNPVNLIFDNPPLASRADRMFLEAQAKNLAHFLRLLLDGGRVLFYLGENGFVKPFSPPNLVSLLNRRAGQGKAVGG